VHTKHAKKNYFVRNLSLSINPLRLLLLLLLLLLAGGGVFQGGTSIAARQRGRAVSPRNVSPIYEGIHIRHTYKGIHIRHKSYI
jgi:hypothetical protein